MVDLRSFLDQVRQDRPQDIVTVKRCVNPNYETTAILAKFEQSYRLPIFYFEDVEGCSFPLVTNVCGSLSRLALALGVTVAELSQRYENGCKNPIKPKVIDSAAVQDEVVVDGDVDLGVLPKLIYHEKDCDKPYITAAIVVAVDPETGKSNLSFHRLMIAGRNRTGIYMAAGKHLDGIYQKYVAKNQAMPIAAFIGVHPILSLGGVYTGSTDVEEYDIIGGLQGKALRVVECVKNKGLFVPADAEFVLEGIVRPNERIEEGPFGEFTGYATGTMQTPVLEVQAITNRKNPIYQDIASGHSEHLVLPILGMEYSIKKVAQSASPSIKNVKIVAPLTIVVSIEKSDDAAPRKIIEALCKSDIYTKHVTIVDADVNVSDARQVNCAVALNVQPDQDVFVFKDLQGTPLDPSCRGESGITSKLGIDATAPLIGKRKIERNTIAKQLLDKIDMSEFLDNKDS